MTLSIIPQDTRSRRFLCVGGETVFSITFPFFAAADIAVRRQRAGATSLLVEGVDYTVAGAGNPAGGSVTLLAAALAGDLIVVVSEQPEGRTSGWTDGQALTATALNAEFARKWIALQQLRRDINRGLRLPIVDPEGGLELPDAGARASKFMAFNGSGEVIAAEGSIGGVPVSPFIATLLDDADAAEARDTLGATPIGAALFTAADAAAVRTQAGATATGSALITAADAAAVRTQAGATATGSALITAADAAAVRTQAGATTTGSALITAEDAQAARTAIVAPPTPTNSAGVGQWVVIGNTLPAGGTWAWFSIGFSGGGPVTHAAGVSAGGSTVVSGATVYTGFAWRIA
jgi:hypothetical protein